MSNTPIFTRLFGPSPISPIQKQMDVCSECAQELIPFMDAVLDGNWNLAHKHAHTINDLEGQADDIKKKVRLSLPRSLFLPVPRGDLLELLQVQDSIPNASKDIAGLILGRQMQFPVPIHESLKVYTACAISAVTLAKTAMDELNDLVSTGFSGQEIDFIEDILDRLHTAEHESDVLQVEVRRMLFDLERDLNPVDVMFMYRIIDLIGDVADNAQTVGNRMMYLIAS
ncbi:MAG: TIGR00153 family protein [Proteobacteria bacterium]|nr:TIGR00153 family protein [Pseudomonadota bacterium]